MTGEDFDGLVGSLAEKLYAHTPCSFDEFVKVTRAHLVEAGVNGLATAEPSEGMVDDLMTMTMQVQAMSRRVRGEPEQVTLDTCPLHNLAVSELQNACIALSASISWKHRKLLESSYKGKTLEQVLKERMDSIYKLHAARANVEPEQVHLSHAEILKAIDETP